MTNEPDTLTEMLTPEDEEVNRYSMILTKIIVTWLVIVVLVGFTAAVIAGISILAKWLL